MNEHDIQLGKELGEIKADLRSISQQFSEFKIGIGRKLEASEVHIQNHCKEINELEVNMKMLLRVSYFILSTCGGAVILAILSLIVKRV